LTTTWLTPTATNKSTVAHHQLSGTATDATIRSARVNPASHGSKPCARARGPPRSKYPAYGIHYKL
jgi:hypothetical protein